MESVEREIRYYETPEGQTPLVDWLESLDMQTQQIVETRIARVKLGNFGDCKSVGGGVKELRIRLGGIRIYFAEETNQIVLLLSGGAKGTQAKDIKKAKEYWTEYKRS